ncbi:amidophosphoribosyltransferase [Planctomycetota bacterium]
MGGFFGVASKKDCVNDLFYGTDYHSHLGTKKGGIAVINSSGIQRDIHDISNAQFRSKFADNIDKMHGNIGIGVISDTDDQPLIIASHLGTYSIVVVGKINNIPELAEAVFSTRTTHFAEMGGGQISPTEIVASLINKESTFEAGIKYAQEMIDGSCSLFVMTDQGIYVARDRLGRTPVVIGEKDGAYAATLETCAFPNLDFRIKSYIGPGEIVLMTPEGIEQKKAPGEDMQICTFLWVYYGYPSSNYENINVEIVRNRCGAFLATGDDEELDLVAGIPDSGTGHALGYANKAGIPYGRPFVKYTPTWPRSFMPQVQTVRDLVARMKLIPIKELISGKRILFCEDSIVRGTQLQDTIQRLYEYGAEEVHMRPACPPLIHGCRFLNFSQSKSEFDLAGHKAIQELEGDNPVNLADYAQSDSDKYNEMVDSIRRRLDLTTLKYQKLENLVEAVGLPKDKLCTYCWDGCHPGG